MSVILRLLRKIKGEKANNESLVEQLRAKGAKIGKNVVLSGTTLDSSYPFLIQIGDNTVLSACRVLTHDASSMSICGYSKVGKVVIGNDCFVGADAILLPGTVIGDRVIIGSGAIVSSTVEGNGVYVGGANGLRKLSTYDEYKEKVLRRFESGRSFDLHWSNMTAEDQLAILESLKPGEIGFLR